MNPTSEEHDRRRTPLRWVRYPASGRASELEEMVSVTEAVTAVVIDGDEISQSDTDGADIVITIAEELRAFDVSPSFARVGPEIRDLWQRAGVMGGGRTGTLFPTVRAAVDAVTSDVGSASRDGSEGA